MRNHQEMKHAQVQKPPIDQEIPEVLETATFSMGCFWSPDALFGSMEGVVRTRVGYAGGTTAKPTYWTLADHIETVQLHFDPDKIDYQQLLHLFFSSHKATRPPWKRQYMPAVFYHSPEQEQQARQAKAQVEHTTGKEVYTEIHPYKEFFLAEDRHQKYKLQRQPELLEEFQDIYPVTADLLNSTAAARVNGYLYGYGKREQLQQEIDHLGLSPAGQQLLLQKAKDKAVTRCGS